jgi:transposase
MPMIRVAREDYDEKSKDEILDDLEKALNDRERVEQELEKLKRELRKYKGPNTPPSAHPHLKSVAALAPRAQKRGAPNGHPGSTRPRQAPHEERRIMADECPCCHCHDLVKIRDRHQQLEDAPPEIKPRIIDVTRGVFKCRGCGLRFDARDHRTPLQGRFGVNMMVLVILLKFVLRGVLRKTARFLEACSGCPLAPASVQAIISRASAAATSEYEAIKTRIRMARIVYADETSFRVLGTNWWCWVFRSDTDMLLVLRPSRGANVLEEILGKRYKGILVCDCWNAYGTLPHAKVQRCWSHLLRKAKLLTTPEGKAFYDQLGALFACIERFNRNKCTRAKRMQRYERLTTELQRLLDHYATYREDEELYSVLSYIGNHLGEWFTCVKLAGAEPTNNFAEQAIRETVIVRKIIGAFRSEQGPETYTTIASLLATWQLQKKDLRTELTRTLTATMC